MSKYKNFLNLVRPKQHAVAISRSGQRLVHVHQSLVHSWLALARTLFSDIRLGLETTTTTHTAHILLERCSQGKPVLPHAMSLERSSFIYCSSARNLSPVRLNLSVDFVNYLTVFFSFTTISQQFSIMVF